MYRTYETAAPCRLTMVSMSDWFECADGSPGSVRVRDFRRRRCRVRARAGTPRRDADRPTSATNHAATVSAALCRDFGRQLQHGTQRQQCRHGPVVAPASLHRFSRASGGRRRRGRSCHVWRGRRRQRAVLAARPHEHRLHVQSHDGPARLVKGYAIVVLTGLVVAGLWTGETALSAAFGGQIRRSSHAQLAHRSRNWTTTSSSWLRDVRTDRRGADRRHGTRVVVIEQPMDVRRALDDGHLALEADASREDARQLGCQRADRYRRNRDTNANVRCGAGEPARAHGPPHRSSRRPAGRDRGPSRRGRRGHNPRGCERQQVVNGCHSALADGLSQQFCDADDFEASS